MFKLLDRLESVVMDGIPIPLLPYSLVNQEKMILLLDKIQTAIPEEVQQADQVLEHKEELLQETQRKAQQIIQDAKQQADFMLSESELMKAVHLEAERVRQQVMTELNILREQTQAEVDQLKWRAEEESKALKHQAEVYADTVLKAMTQNLEEFQLLSATAHKQLKRARVDLSHLKTVQTQQHYAQKPSSQHAQKQTISEGRFTGFFNKSGHHAELLDELEPQELKI